MGLTSDKEQQKYGVLRYSSINIGDEIQSIAAMRFLPKIDYYVPRERSDEFHSKNGESVKMIMNAWWMWDKEHFPPSKDIDPLYISFFLRKVIRDGLMTNKVIDYFKQHEPIGCRDAGTAKYLQSKGIDAYFSGCLTMTLLPNTKLKEKGGDYILCVDVPKKMRKIIAERAQKPVYDVTRMMSPAFTSKDRLKLAKFMLYIYHNAYCVVTPRLHVALPCTAFGTPVCVLTTKTWKSEVLTRRGRFDGLEHIFNEVLIEDYIKNPDLYDINNPPPNPETHHAMRDKLVETCTKFTGYDKDAPVFEDDYNPLLEITKLLAYDKKVIKRLLLFADTKDLFRAWLRKKFKKRTRHDLSY